MNAHYLDDGLSDEALDAFFENCFQDIIDDRQLHPAWACMDCRDVNYGEKPGTCTRCDGDRLYQIATFQGRGSATGNIFQDAVLHVFERFFSQVGVISSRESDFRDSCDFFVPNVAGIEAKGSPAHVTLPIGKKVILGRPGMRRTDTEKKANSNAVTFKQDHERSDVRFYVLSNALPDGWHEEHSAIDGIFDVTSLKDWKELVYDLDVDKKRASRIRRGRR